MSPLPPLAEPLADATVVLRHAAERDIPEVLIAHQDDPSLSDALRLRRPPSGAELGRAIEETEDRLAVGAGVTLTITEPGDDDCVGQVEVDAIDPDHRRTDLRVWVAPGRRGRGLGRAALALASGWLIEQGGLERVQLLVEPDNVAMLRAATRAGFTTEGQLRGYLLRRAGRFDVVVLSRVARDLMS